MLPSSVHVSRPKNRIYRLEEVHNLRRVNLVSLLKYRGPIITAADSITDTVFDIHLSGKKGDFSIDAFDGRNHCGSYEFSLEEEIVRDFQRGMVDPKVLNPKKTLYSSIVVTRTGVGLGSILTEVAKYILPMTNKTHLISFSPEGRSHLSQRFSGYRSIQLKDGKTNCHFKKY